MHFHQVNREAQNRSECLSRVRTLMIECRTYIGAINELLIKYPDAFGDMGPIFREQSEQLQARLRAEVLEPV
jgi:hypothetical protein